MLGKDIKTGDYVYINSKRSHVILVCGKRGSGKSYTLGVMIEELMDEGNSLVIVIDPMGIYHTMSQPNYEQEELLWEWGLSARSYNVQVLVPGDPLELYGGGEIVEAMKSRGVCFKTLQINPADLSPESWCELFGIGISDVMGIVLTRAVHTLYRARGKSFYISDIIEAIDSDPLATDKTRQALVNRLEMAMDWGIFSSHYQDLWEIFDRNSINVVDLSVLDPGPRGRRNLILDVLAKDLFRRRTIARRKEELGLSTDLPKVWMFVDEAHQFVPSGKMTLSKDILIRWAKEGRQPGLSLVAATQQPSAVDSEIITQCDIIIAQKLTNSLDISALNALNQDYMGSELKTFIRKLKRVGEAVIVDDERENVQIVQIRPRKSHHGGGER